jgi:hypothetical protein
MGMSAVAPLATEQRTFKTGAKRQSRLRGGSTKASLVYRESSACPDHFDPSNEAYHRVWSVFMPFQAA